MDKSGIRSSGLGAQVSCGGNLNWLQRLPKLLSPANMSRLRRSCLGHLLDIDKMKFQGQLYHLLMRNHFQYRSVKIICFNFDDRVAVFGPTEYALITGLKFGDYYEPPATSVIHTTVFGRRTSLYFSHIEKALVEVCENGREDSELALQLAYLFVLYSTILFRGSGKKPIETKYLHVVDNLKAFDDYAWGHVGYEFMRRAMHSRWGVIDGWKSPNKMKYEVYGFVWALQCWAYEIFPQLASECAIKIEANKDRFPRILRWKATDSFKFDYLARFFLPGNNQLVPIVPIEAEILRLTRLGIDLLSSQLPHNIVEIEVQSKRKGDSCVADGKGKKKIKTIQNISDKVRRRSTRIKKVQFENGVDFEENTGVGTSAADSMSRYSEDAPKEDISTNVTLHELDAQLKYISSRYLTVEDFMRKMSGLMVLIFAKVVYLEGCICHKKCDEGHNESRNSFCKKTSDQVNITHDGDGAKCLATPNTLNHTSPMKKKIVVEASSLVELSDEDVEILGTSKFRSQSLCSSYTKGVVRKLFQSPVLPDPMELTFKLTSVKAFNTWYDANKTLQPPVYTTLPICYKPKAPANWFEQIWDYEGHLGCDHIDALLNLLMYKSIKTPGAFLTDWTIFEWIGGGLVMDNVNYKSTLCSVKGYVLGAYPHQRRVPWVSVDRVIGIANVNTNHWVTYEAKFSSQTITIYDSLSKCSRFAAMAEKFQNLARFFPWICKTLGVWASKHMTAQLVDEWDVVSFKDAPQQLNGSDCGIMAMKFVECLVSGYDVTDIDPGRCRVFRKSYCGQLYNMGLVEPAEDPINHAREA